MARALALTIVAALCLAGLVGCDSGDANEEGTIPRKCGLPSPGPKVDPSRVPDQYLLDGTAIVRKVTERNDLFVVALNVPLTVNAAYGAYLDALGPPRYRVITKENEGFEAEIYLRDVHQENLMAVQIRQPQCTEAVSVYITEDRRETR
jgi:hypothetical protein